MINVEVKRNYDNDELFCTSCKERIKIGEKYLVIIDQLYDGEVDARPVHLDCVEETPEDDFDEPFFGRT